VILAGIVVGMVVRGIDGRFSSDLIESSQYMQERSRLLSKFGSVCSWFFFPEKSSKFSFRGERETARRRGGGRRAVRQCERLPCSIVGFHIIFKEASGNENLGGLCEEAQRRSSHLILLGETC
jgi:hypothetical protein